MSQSIPPSIKRSNWRGFTLQLFLVTILPLTALVLLVAFGSQMLHHDAMRNLVGDRDLRTVEAASISLEREITHLSSALQTVSHDLSGKTDFSSLDFRPEEISATFDGGMALFSGDRRLLASSSSKVDWQTIPSQIPDNFKFPPGDKNQPIFSSQAFSAGTSHPLAFISILTDRGEILVGAFSPERVINDAIGNLAGSGQTTVLVVSPVKESGGYDFLYRGGPSKADESLPNHPGITEALRGESGINYFQSSQGEHVVAFTPVRPTGWGLVIEEAWEDIASPYLDNTQSAPLVIVPVFLLALFALWFGARSIVTPLQKLENQAAGLATGDFEAIRKPVGGIEEIRNLQAELVDMADKLEAAQHSLRSYIGAITAGVENERRSLARELHDDTIQSLIALNQRIQFLEMNTPQKDKAPMSQLLNLIQQSMNNLRRIIRGLRPIYLEDLGLVASVEMLVQELAQSSTLPVIFSSKGTERRLSPQTEMSLYRIIQESLNNVLHHADAKHAGVDLEWGHSDLTVKIRDDGKGFVVPTNAAEFPEKGHFGLLGLHERSDLINADLKIISKLGEGTAISIRLSISDEPEE